MTDNAVISRESAIRSLAEREHREAVEGYERHHRFGESPWEVTTDTRWIWRNRRTHRVRWSPEGKREVDSSIPFGELPSDLQARYLADATAAVNAVADHLALGVSQSELLEPCARIVYADRCNRIPWLREQGVEYDALQESVKTGYRELIRSALTALEVG